MLFCTNLCWC